MRVLSEQTRIKSSERIEQKTAEGGRTIHESLTDIHVEKPDRHETYIIYIDIHLLRYSLLCSRAEGEVIHL